MTSKIDTAATQSIYQMQFWYRDAIRYVQRNTGCDEATAVVAVKNAMTFHRQPK
jgi:hypothetical protein